MSKYTPAMHKILQDKVWSIYLSKFTTETHPCYIADKKKQVFTMCKYEAEFAFTTFGLDPIKQLEALLFAREQKIALPYLDEWIRVHTSDFGQKLIKMLND